MIALYCMRDAGEREKKHYFSVITGIYFIIILKDKEQESVRLKVSSF